MSLSNPGSPHTSYKSNGPGPLSNRPAAILLTLVVTLVASRFWRLTASCLWFDEIFSVHATRHSWAEMMHFVAADIIHPPLFYALLKIWTAIGGESLLWLRLFPALLGIAVIIPLVMIGRELRMGRASINLALLLMTVNGYLIKYAQEVRMYSLLLLLSLCSLWLLIRFVKLDRPAIKHLLPLFAVNLLLVYTHYSGWLVVVLEACATLLWFRGKVRPVLLGATTLALAYIPWIYEVTRTATEFKQQLAQNIGWVARPFLKHLFEYFTLLNKPFSFSQSSLDAGYNSVSLWLSILLFGVPLLLAGLRQVRLVRDEGQRWSTETRLLWLFAFGPALLVFILSWILPKSVWGTRHLIIASGPYSLLVAQALVQLRPDWAKIAANLLLGSWILLSAGVFLIGRPPVFIWCCWEQLAPQMVAESNSTSTIRVYAFEDLVAYHLWFNLERTCDGRCEVRVVKGLPGVMEDPAYFLPRRFDGVRSGDKSSLTGDEIWVAFRDINFDERRPPLDFLQAEGYHAVRVLSTTAQGQQAFLVRLERK